jgi:hypothetical protein
MSDEPEIPRFVRCILFVDFKLMVACIRPVWWIDHRYHFNSYRQARVVIRGAMVVHLIGFALLLTSGLPWFSKLFFGVASCAYINMEMPWQRRLAKASRDYERDPARLTIDRAFFHWQAIPPLRLMMLVLGLHLFVLLGAVAFIPPFRAAQDIGFVLFNSWTLISSVGLYVAAVPPPPMDRKKKEERAPLFALPSPA